MPLISGIVGHSYSLNGKLNRDIAETISGLEAEMIKRARKRLHGRCGR